MKIVDVTPRFDAAPGRGSDVRIHGVLRQISRSHEVRQFSQATWQDLRWQPRSRTIRHSSTWEQWQWVHPLAAALGGVPVRAWPNAPLWAGRALSLFGPRKLDTWLAWADVVLVEFPWQFDFCRRRRAGGPLVYASMNVEAQKFASWARASGVDPEGDRWVKWVERVEAEAVRGANCILAVSEADAEDFTQRYGCPESKLVVVPNGADTTRIRPVPMRVRPVARRRLDLPERPTVLFAGSDVPANRVGLDWLGRVAALAPEFSFVAVGSVSAPAVVRGNLTRLGFVEDFGAALAAADYALVPIEHGGGTKIKLLEFLAAGLPTLAFADCLGGLELPVVCVEKNARAIADALRSLARDPERASQLSHAARDAIAPDCDWQETTAPLERALAKLG
ncbi:MAG: glycosyltransferase family 4 protein [Deltaproteobacteria bacterium]|nr:glycosyltransferase family 4 protein [Deltaproteobacteria bacterium]